MNNSPMIIADNLTCRFGSTLAVDHLSLSILPGHIVGLLGPNGAGKTTTLRMLLGLIPADSGSSSLLGCPSMKLSPEVKERIGYVPEDDALYGWKSAKGMLNFHGQFYPGYTKEHSLDDKIRLIMLLDAKPFLHNYSSAVQPIRQPALLM